VVLAVALVCIAGMSPVASAVTNVWIEEIADCNPGSYCNPLEYPWPLLIGVYSDGGLTGLDAILTVVGGTASIPSAINRSDCADYGWDPALSNDPYATSLTMEIGVGQFTGPYPSGLVAYYVLSYEDGDGDVQVTLSPGTRFGGSADANLATPTIGGSITVYGEGASPDDVGCLFTSSTSGGSVTEPGEGRFRYKWDGAPPVKSIVAQADVGYQFAEWTGLAVDAGSVLNPYAASTTVTMVEGCNTVVVANFAVAPRRTLTVSSTSGGSVTDPGEDAFEYDHQQIVPIVAEAQVGYEFVEWTGTAVDAGDVDDPCAASTTVTMNGDYTLVANFGIYRPTLTVSSGSGGSVTDPGEDTFEYDYGQTVPIVAEAEAGYEFVEWTGTAVDVGKVDDPCAAGTTVTMHGDYTLVANFGVYRPTLTVSSGSGGSVTFPGEDTFEYAYGEIAPIIAVADPDYDFLEWTGTAVDAGKVDDPCAAGTTVTMHGDYTVVANFVRLHRTLTVSSTSGGSVTDPGEDTFEYDYQQVVPIVAEAQVGYVFTEWTGTAVDAGDVDDPCAAGTTVTMNDDYTLVANFGIYRPTLTISSTWGGSVTFPGEDTFDYGYGDTAGIIAVADAGYYFVQWTGTAVDAGKVADPCAAGTTVTMHDDYTAVANFTPPISAVIYVDAGAAGANNGSSWTDAYWYMQDALADAAVTGREIWVAEGSYYPDESKAVPGGTRLRTDTFQLISGVAIYGGFPAGGGDWEQRYPNAYETILTGDINTPGDANDNSYHVVTGSGTEPNAVLDGFTITAGNAAGGGGGTSGAGMYNVSSSPTVKSCFFTRNFANSSGGAMANDQGSSPFVTNCLFVDNSAGTAGGAMANMEASNSEIVNCFFAGNAAMYGGAMVNGPSGSPRLTNCVFTGNTASDSAGAIATHGSSWPVVINCTFSGNIAALNSGAIGSGGPDLTIANCIFWGNGAPTGPQIDGISVLVSFSDVQGGWPGTGNINVDPCFVDADGPDDIVGTEDDNLQLAHESPCIDAADSNSVPADTADLDGDGNTIEPIPFDLDGHTRIIDGDCNDTDIVDMGAYEFNYAYMGDFDGQCDVDFVDYAIFALAFSSQPPDENWNRFCDISVPPDEYIDWGDAKILCDNWLAHLGP
jgi:parallel beta-helix repeat protein